MVIRGDISQSPGTPRWVYKRAGCPPSPRSPGVTVNSPIPHKVSLSLAPSLYRSLQVPFELQPSTSRSPRPQPQRLRGAARGDPGGPAAQGPQEGNPLLHPGWQLSGPPRPRMPAPCVSWQIQWGREQPSCSGHMRVRRPGPQPPGHGGASVKRGREWDWGSWPNRRNARFCHAAN